MSIEDRLLSMKRQLEKSKSEENQIKGALNNLFETLDKEFKLKNLKEGDNLLEELSKKDILILQDIQIKIQDLEKNYDWV